MGIVSSPLIDSHDLKSIIQGNEEKSKLSDEESLWNKVLEAQQAKRRSWQVKKGRVTWKNNGHIFESKKPKMILMKKRAHLEGSRMPSNMNQRKVKTLKKLIPNRDESMSLDGLFKETADYILALQMRVQVMQILVNVLTGSDE